MKRCFKQLASLGLCAVVASGVLLGVNKPVVPLAEVNAESEQVEVSDLVIKFLGVPEYEPNRYTKSNGGKWAPEELEKGLHIKAEMKLGEGNPEGMMAPLKHSFADITAAVDANQKTGEIKITYNGLTLKMNAGSTTATLNNGKTTKTLTMKEEVVPYFMAVEGEKAEDGGQYYACYLPVKFTAEALGADVIWNQQMHRMEMAFAFYYSDGAVEPDINSKAAYTTKGMESDKYKYTTLRDRILKADLDTATVQKNIAEMVKASLTVVNSVYQNDDGGWGKTNKEYDLLSDTFAAKYTHAYSTFDNGATHGHIKFLGRVLRLAKENPALFAEYQNDLAAIEKGFWKAVRYMVDAQDDLGGWPQYYPYGVGYFKNITFNDNAMPDVLDVIYALTNDEALLDSTMCEDLAWARQAMKDNTAYVQEAKVSSAQLQKAWDDGLAFTLAAQVKIDGVVTGWAQQYDPEASIPTPIGGRAFELPSVSPNESNAVLAVLTNIVNPSREVKTAIENYVTWVQSVSFTGYSQVNISDRTRELGKDRMLVADGSTKPTWGRFYGLDVTGEYYGVDIKDKLTDGKFYPIFAGRDGVAQLTMNIGMSERRSGYSYVNTNAGTNAKKTYDQWAAKNAE